MHLLTRNFGTKMNFIAIKESTGELFYSKGANKLARIIGISASTVTRKGTNTFSNKLYNGFRYAKCKEIEALDRGNNIKDNLNSV